MSEVNEKTVKEIWNDVETILNDNPTHFKDVNIVYQFDLQGEDGGTYQLVFRGESAKVLYDTVGEPQCILKMKVSDFKKFLRGNMNSTTAFMMGKLQVQGSIGLALKLEKLLGHYEL